MTKTTSALLLLLLISSIAPAAQLIMPAAETNRASASGSSSSPVISADGSNIVFVSYARDLTTNRADGVSLNLFLRNLTTSNTILISATPLGTGGNGNSAWASVSSNGEFVAFVSDASNLVSGDTNNSPDVFIRDVAAAETRLVSRAPDGSVSLPEGLGRNTGVPLISSDGRLVVFETLATNLVSGSDSNGVADIVIANTIQHTNALADFRGAAPGVTPSRGASLVGITPDASRIAYISRSGDEIDPSAPTNSSATYVRDLAAGQSFWCSRLESFYTNHYDCVAATLSTDGHYLALMVTASNYPLQLFRCAVNSEAAGLLASDVTLTTPGISANGRFVAYESGGNVWRWDAVTGESVIVAGDGSRFRDISASGDAVLYLTGLSDSAIPGSLQLRSMSSGITTLIASASGTAGTPSLEHASAVIASGGDRIAFDSSTDDLTLGDNNRQVDVFLRESSGAKKLISARAPASPTPRSTRGHMYLNSSCVSSNGDYVLLSSFDSDLVANDTNRMADLFIFSTRDAGMAKVVANEPITMFSLSGNGDYIMYVTPAGQIVRVDRRTKSRLIVNGPQRRNLASLPAISADGSLIGYCATNNFLYVYNTETGGLTTLANYVFPIRKNPRDWTARDCIFTPDSRFLLFKWDWELRLWDRLTGLTERARYSPTRNYYVDGSFATPSADSRFVVSAAANYIQRHEIFATNTSEHSFGDLIVDLSISRNAEFIAGSTSNSRPQVIFLDTQTGSQGYISTTPSGLPGNGRSYAPAVSADGRFVAYLSDSTNIVQGMNGNRQVLLRDRLLGATTLLSAGLDGEPGESHSSRPIFSLDGSTLVFQSMAENLAEGDYNDRRDIFMMDFRNLDTDGDGLDDEWEVAHFGNLAHNGEIDSDQDGSTDLHEFLAGTDPTNGDSVLRAMVVADVGTGQKRLIWSGSPTRSYHVEFKDSIETPVWTPLDATVSWTGTTATALDAAAAAKRFYRILRLP